MLAIGQLKEVRTSSRRGSVLTVGWKAMWCGNAHTPKQPRGPTEARGSITKLTSVETCNQDSAQRVQWLRRELHEAVVAAAVGVTAGVMHTVAAAGKEHKCQLGPIIFTTINVNGFPAKTLVDTGSPATIISLEFVLDVFIKNRSPQQTAAQWQVETQKRFSEPNITLSTYSRRRLDILVETHLRLSQGGQTVEAPVLVRKDAPNPLLLGTDLQSQLGFALVMISPQARVDLLSGSPMVQVGEVFKEPDKSTDQSDHQPPPTTNSSSRTGGGMVQVGEVMGKSDHRPQPITNSSSQTGSGMVRVGGR